MQSWPLEEVHQFTEGAQASEREEKIQLLLLEMAREADLLG